MHTRIPSHGPKRSWNSALDRRMLATKTHPAYTSTKTEHDYLYGWTKHRLHTQKSHHEWWHPEIYRPAYPKILLSVLRTAYVRIFRFLTRSFFFFFFFFFADAPPISQNEAVSKVNFSITHLVRTVCELKFSNIQMHYTRTTLFCLHLRKSFSIEDSRTFLMHRVCCFLWCRLVLLPS